VSQFVDGEAAVADEDDPASWQQIAVHPRSYEREDFIANPLHYPTADGGPQRQRGTARVHPGAAPHSARHAPARARTLRTLRAILVEWMWPARWTWGNQLRCSQDDRAGPARKQRVPRLDLQFYPHLPRANVGRTDPRSYMGLLASRHSSDGSSSMSDPMMPLPAIEAEPTSVPPAVLLANHLKALKLPSFAREYEKLALEAAQGRADYPRYLLRLCELERMDRERRMVERRIRMAWSRIPRALTPSTLRPSHHRTRRWYWNWRAGNGSSGGAMSLRWAPAAPARPTPPSR
jgi:hypothetical protein